MKISEMRERPTSDLQNLEKELVTKHWKARLDNYTNQLDDTSQLKKLRRDIARAKTALVERTRQEEGK